jgi:CHRD domain-containing protein
MNIPRDLILASVISLALITTTAVTSMPTLSYAQQHFTANLNGAGVFPPVTTNATGKATFDLVNNGEVMKYNISALTGSVKPANVNTVVISHTTGGRVTDLVSLRSATQQGLTGPKTSGSLVGNFTSKDITGGGNIPGFKTHDMPSLVKDILSGNVYVKVGTVNFPLGAIGGKISP